MTEINVSTGRVYKDAVYIGIVKRNGSKWRWRAKGGNVGGNTKLRRDAIQALANAGTTQ